MSRPNPYTKQLNDPDSTMVKDALTRRCIVCGAKPGRACTNTMVSASTMPSGVPLPDRIVHYARTTE
jgi:hypothetical protein